MTMNPLWQLPPTELTLSPNIVHVWRASLRQRAECVHQLASLLSATERSRAARLHFERDRRRFVVGRGLLRVLLGRYLGLDPSQVHLRYERYGKPYLAEDLNRSQLRFNLARAHELALYAFASGRQIGIDLERVRPMLDAEQIAAQFFSAQENQVLRALPQAQRLEGFFNCWTRKEAYLKAGGEGLARSLESFDVSLVPGEAARLLHVEGRPGEIDRWSLETFIPAPGNLATLAVEGGGWQPTYFEVRWHDLAPVT